MNLIIFTGAPASGKSALAGGCAKELGIPWYSKDCFKIELFEKYGFTSHSEKKALSIKGEQQLIDTIKVYCESDKDIIIDNNFKNYNSLRSAISKERKHCNIICICLYADSALLAKRYNERIASGRRAVPLYVLNQYPVIDGITEYHKPLDAVQVDNIQSAVTEETYGDHIVYIDTNRLEYEFLNIQLKVVEYIKNNLK